MAASLLSAAIGAAGTIGGQLLKNKGYKDASKMQAQGAAQAMAQRQAALDQAGQIFDEAQTGYASFLPLGERAQGFLLDYTGRDPDQALTDYETSPIGLLAARNRAEAIRRVQGERAAIGGYKSGGTMTDLTNRTSAVDMAGLTSFLGTIGNMLNAGYLGTKGASDVATTHGKAILGVGDANASTGYSDYINRGNALGGQAAGTAQMVGDLAGIGAGLPWKNYLSPKQTGAENPNSWATTVTPAPSTSWATTVAPANNFADLNFWPG